MERLGLREDPSIWSSLSRANGHRRLTGRGPSARMPLCVRNIEID